MSNPEVDVDQDPTPTVRSTPDPDPTPTATPWQEYLAAAQSLDAVLREAAAEAAAASRASSVPRAELATIRTQLERQRAQLVGEAVRAGLPAPSLIPRPAEQAAAESQVGGDHAAAGEALRHCQHLLVAADAYLAGAPTSPAPTGGAPVAAAPGRPVPAGAGRSLWPPPLWLVIAAPLTAATLLLCGITFLLVITR